MNWKILILLAIVVLGFISFLGYRNQQSDPDKLFANLIEQVQEGKFENIYANSSDFLQLNANKEKFTDRMIDALEKMKQADGDLNFKRDLEREASIEYIERESDKVIGRNTPNDRILVIQKLGTGDNEVTVLLFWEYRGLIPKFNDLAVMPKHSERQDLYVKGIAYKK